MDFTIALDGPAASGKTTLGERLAKTLNFTFLDTGVMYRAVTLAALHENVDIDNEEAVSQIAEQMELDVRQPSVSDGRSNDIILNGQDVTWAIRSADVERSVSKVSAYARVRTAMTKQQRRIGQRGKIIMVGRDIGTVVLPEAEIKLYLEASTEERARRRYLELINRGKNVTFEEILSDMIKRDQYDSTRTIAPLRPAEDAIIINSENCDANQVYEYILEMIVNYKSDRS